MKLKNKIALITGGGSGIGAAVAKRFVEEGAKICIAGRRNKLLEQVAESLPAESVLVCPGDLGNPADIEKMVESTAAFGGGLDILVNCAAYNVGGSITTVDPSDWEKSLRVNLTGTMLLMRAAIPHMIKGGGGSVINISSLAGIRSVPQRVAYCSTKAGMIMLTKQAALDYGSLNIRCNVICPAAVETPMTAGWFADIKENMGMEKGFKSVPLKRPGTSAEIAGICCFLAGEDSSFVTGALIMADGGINVVDPFAATTRM